MGHSIRLHLLRRDKLMQINSDESNDQVPKSE